MSPTENERTFERSRQRYVELTDLIKRSQAELSAHRQIMEGLVRLDSSLGPAYRQTTGRVQLATGEKIPPHIAASVSPAPAISMKGLDSLRQIFADRPGEALSVGTVLALLIARGWDPGGTKNARRALDRAVQIGVAEKLDDPKDRRANLYRWKEAKISHSISAARAFDAMNSGGRRPEDAPGQ